MINRIYSDDYSCFNQKTELKMKYGDDTVKFVSDFYTRLKIEALLLGKIVLTDSRFFDLPAFKLMKDDELLAFFDTARDNNMLEVRYRPNTKRSGLIKQMFLKKYWFESTSNQQLSNFLLNIGDELAALEGNGRIIIDDTIESYFRSIEIYKGAELKVIRSSYENFKDRMILLEEIRTKRCKSLFVPWGERAEDLAQTPKYRDLSDVMSQNKKTMIDLFTNRVNDLDDNSKQVILKELNKPWPLLTEVKIAAAKSEKSKEFYTLFQNWYKLGIACQHFSNIVELQHQPASSDMLELTLGSGSRRKAFQVNLFPKEIREIINEDWGSFSKRIKMDGLRELRNELWTAVNKGHIDGCREAIKKMRQKFSLHNDGATDDHDIGVSTANTDKRSYGRSLNTDIIGIKFYV